MSTGGMFVFRIISTSVAAVMLTSPLLGQSSTADSAHVESSTLYGTWGVDISAIDRGVRPGDDFAMYAFGSWYRTVSIPTGAPAVGVRLDQRKLNDAKIRSVIEQSLNHPTTRNRRLIRALYQSYMDTSAIERRGVLRLKRDLAEIRELPTKAAVAELMGRTPGTLGMSFFDRTVGVNLQNPKQHILRLQQSGLGAGNRAPYLDSKLSRAKLAYESHAALLLKVAGWDAPEANASQIVDLETRIAEVSWDAADSQDPAKINNVMSVKQLQDLAPGFEWRAYLSGAGVSGIRKVAVNERSAFPAIAKIFATTPLSTLKAWLAFHKIERLAPYLSKEVRDADFEFSGKMRGMASPPPRQEGAFNLVNTNLVDPVGEEYMERFFPHQDRSEVNRILANVRMAARSRIAGNNWISAATKSEALKKLDALKVSIGYPDRWRDYSRLELKPDDLYGNIQRLAEYDWAWQRGKLNRPVDRGEWFMAPYVVGAASNRYRIHITFSAGILTPPNFDLKADPAVNYGGIGAIIGHEIGHLFDDQGWKIDATGAVRDWWTPGDRKTFLDKMEQLQRLLEMNEMAPGEKLDAKSVLGETMANLFGQEVALDAYHASLKGRSAPLLGGFTGDQRFFLAFAQTWRAKSNSPDFWRQMGNQAPPGPSVNTIVRNIDEWYSAFDVRSGDRLYLDPADRVRIW